MTSFDSTLTARRVAKILHSIFEQLIENFEYLEAA
jgi:hypothetical protein